MLEAAKIVAFSGLAAIIYGILHDQVTAHVCVEYFTIAHPPVFPTDSPFLLAIGWGIIATWWVGLPLGIGLAAASRFGPGPRLGLRDVKRPIVVLMLGSGALAMIAGGMGATLFATDSMPMPDYWREVIPPEKWAAFTFDSWAHLASYSAGALGGLCVIGWSIVKRVKLSRARRAPA